MGVFYTPDAIWGGGFQLVTSAFIPPIFRFLGLLNPDLL